MRPYSSKQKRDTGGLNGIGPTRVAKSCFSFLFSELCSRVYTYPSRVKNVEEVEQRLTALGKHVGTRMVFLHDIRSGGGAGGVGGSSSYSSSSSSSSPARATSVENALRFLTSDLWKEWFGRPADDLQRESSSDRYFLLDTDPLVIEFVDPTADYVDSEKRWNVTYASFMGGMVQGALTAMGFECDVLTYHQPEEGKPRQSLFVVNFSKSVWDRERTLI